MLSQTKSDENVNIIFSSFSLLVCTICDRMEKGYQTWLHKKVYTTRVFLDVQVYSKYIVVKQYVIYQYIYSTCIVVVVIY